MDKGIKIRCSPSPMCSWERDEKWIAKKYRINKKVRARADRKAATAAGKSYRRNKV